MTDLRKVDVSGFQEVDVPRAQGAAPQLQWLDITDLRIDGGYQRGLSRKSCELIVRIARGFDWAFFAPVLVSPIEGGCYAIIDGQHRVHAAALIGIAQVPCSVIVASPEKQAAAFVAVNDHRRRLTKPQIHFASLRSGDEMAVQVDQVCRAAGVVIRETANSSMSGQLRPNETMAVDAIYRCVDAGTRRARLALTCLREYGDRYETQKTHLEKKRTWLSVGIIKPVFDALGIVGIGDDEDALVERFCEIDLESLHLQAKRDAAQDGRISVRKALEPLLVSALETVMRKAA